MPSLLFACGTTGTILAAKGITLKPVSRAKLPLEHGKLVQADAPKDKEIKVDIDTGNHTTYLTVAEPIAKGMPKLELAKLLIRIPIGVRFFKVDPPASGDGTEFFHETGHGYNTLAHYLAPGADPRGQKVQEVILITSHVPPRLDPKDLQGGDFDNDFKKLTPDEKKKRLDQDD